MSSMNSYVSETPTVALAGRSRAEWAAAWATRLGLDTAYLLLGLPAGVIAFTVVITGWATALGLAITLIGLPISLATIVVARGMANAERWRAALVLGAPIRGPYRATPRGRTPHPRPLSRHRRGPHPRAPQVAVLRRPDLEGPRLAPAAPADRDRRLHGR